MCGVCGNSSIDQYKARLYKNLLTNDAAISDSKFIETLCANEVKKAVVSLKRMIGNLPILLSPIIDTSYNLQQKLEDVNPKSVQTASSGLWQSQVCVDASTSCLHTERDCTYTLMTVLKQYLQKKTR